MDPAAAVEAKKFQIQVDRIRWAVRMGVTLSREAFHVRSSAAFDYGAEVGYTLTARFARWPEDGVRTVSYPTTWWDHWKQNFRVRHPWLANLFNVTWNETKETHHAIAVLPAIDLPPELKEGMFPVWFGRPNIATERKEAP